MSPAVGDFRVTIDDVSPYAPCDDGTRLAAARLGEAFSRISLDRRVLETRSLDLLTMDQQSPHELAVLLSGSADADGARERIDLPAGDHYLRFSVAVGEDGREAKQCYRLRIDTRGPQLEAWIDPDDRSLSVKHPGGWYVMERR